MTKPPRFTGPILIVDTIEQGALHLAVLVLANDTAVPPPLGVNGIQVGFSCLATYPDITVWRARFSMLLEQPTTYDWNGTTYPLAGLPQGALLLAYASCNGEEHGDLDRDPEERNAMWRRLAQAHKAAPFSLLLHGGDQIYADEVTEGHPLSAGWPKHVPDIQDPASLDGLRTQLRAGFAARYAALYEHADFAWLAARVPSLMQWDDHDICDGWGSLPAAATGSPVGQTLFSVAREAMLVFQQACVDGDLPKRFADPTGDHLGWTVEAPGLRLVAPDLRGQRSLHQVMDESGWAFMAREAKSTQSGHTFLMSSVPLLGPRLSVIERMMRVVPGIQQYEDDLRDQWQSRAHRASWIRMLSLVRDIAETEGATITALSGEIHLATRAEMALGKGKRLHQLVASGITHRAPPKAWARALGMLATLGEAPLPDAPITIHPLPGQANRYIAERNALILERGSNGWQAKWDLEMSGETPPLRLS